jgi:drug/metabolite transporter, DME family
MILGPRYFKERFDRADGWALAVAMPGVAVLFFGNFQGGERGPLLMGAASGVMFGLFLLWLRRMREYDPVAVTAWNNLGVAALSGLMLATVSPDELAIIPRALTGDGSRLAVGLLALMGCFQIAAPYVLFSIGLRRIASVEGSLLALVEPLLNPVWVALVVGETPTAATLIGGLLIVLALAGRYTLFRSGAGP